MEYQKREVLPKPLVLRLIPYWGLVLVWMVLISLLSTEPFSAENTSRYIDPLLRYLFPHITAAEFVFWHTVIRKSAHFAEFFILGNLAYWALRRGRSPGWRVSWMLQALGLAVLYSLADEAHQAFVPNRTASLFDSGIDSLGAAVSQTLIYLRHVLLARLASLR
ncbi:MAG TPA: VanZ family protein [Candidatus Binatia bacterium]|jgi:VanZ family protein